MIDILEKVESMCKRCREAGAGDNQPVVVQLDNLEMITSLARKGRVFVDMVHTWARKTKEEKEQKQETTKEEPEKAEDDISE